LFLVVFTSHQSEEADFVWEAESEEWEREQNACIGLIDRLFDAFSSVIVTRIRNVVRLHQERVNRIRKTWTELDNQVQEAMDRSPFDQLVAIPLDQLFKHKSETDK
jgi:hypothetical protein